MKEANDWGDLARARARGGGLQHVMCRFCASYLGPNATDDGMTKSPGQIEPSSSTRKSDVECSADVNVRKNGRSRKHAVHLHT